MAGAGQWQFGDRNHLGVQNGTERERQCSDSEQKRVFRRHRRCSMHVGCRVSRFGIDAADAPRNADYKTARALCSPRPEGVTEPILTSIN